MKRLLLLLAVLLSSPAFSTVSVEGSGDVELTNLSGYWKLDENAGTTAADSSGSGHTGTLTNTPAWVVGVSSAALNFTATSSNYVAVSGLPLGNTTTWSISCWFKDSGTKDNVFYGEGNTGTGAPLILIGNNQNTVGDVSFEVRDNSSVNSLIVTTANTWNDGNWHHAVGVHTSKSSMALYVDAVLQNTNSTARGTITNNNARIGSLGRLTGGFSTCTVDQARTYSVALSTTQIATLFYNRR